MNVADAFIPADLAATGLPIAIVEPTIAAVIAGTCTRLRRPPGKLLHRITAGDKLWVREPFHLDAKFNTWAPLAAATMRARPTFAVDLPARAGAATSLGLGKRRFSRELPKQWHRQHLVTTAVRRERLQAITLAEIEAEGFADRAAYIAAWDRNLGYFTRSADTSKPGSWDTDPEVLVIEFRRVAEPLR